MSTSLDLSTADANPMPKLLSERVEELAAKLVLGDTDDRQWVELLEGVRREAATAGRDDVERIAAESLEALVRVAGKDSLEALFSANISRMQQALAPSAAAPPARTPAPVSLGDDPEMISDFILEARDHLTEIEIHMMKLEREPEDREAINTVFRGFHTIKGLAGFLDLGDVQEVAHETETLLDLARGEKLRITPAVVDIVLAAADFLKIWTKRLERGPAGKHLGDAPEKVSLLARIRRGAIGEAAAAPAPVIAVPDQPSATDGTQPAERRSGSDRRADGAETHSVKVDTAKLDFLVDMAGEMVVAQSMIQHNPELAAFRSPAVQRSLAQLARITSDLQKTAMSMRMVPIGGLFQKMSRLVRDLARKAGKQAEMEAIGGETELDRNVVEELSDPLMHMVRNAADHGLELPEERRAASKDPTGRIRLRASHQAGQIVIEVSDDGRGLVREKLLDKARKMGLVEDGAALSDGEVFNLIFHAGLSTAEQVSDVSGRGVGMDVVRKQIQKLRGRIEIESAPGRGTSFFLRLPLTLAIIDGLVVGVGGQRYIVPIFSVREMLRPSPEMVFTVEGQQEMAMVRNSLLPIVRLHQRFGVAPRSELATESLLVVAETAGTSFCLMVDELIGKQEVVIKSLGETIKDIPGIAGCAIMGDGRIALILDLEGVFRAGAR